MDIVKAFTFISEDEEWAKKLGIAALVALAGSLLLLPMLALFGYMALVVRNVMNYESKPLPQWNDWSKLFGAGLVVFVAQTIYTLPFLLISCFAVFSLFGMNASGSDFSGPGLFGLFSSFGIWIVVMVVALTVISPAIYIQYAREGTFGSTMNFARVFAIGAANAGSIFVAAIVTTIVGFLFFGVIAFSTVATFGLGSMLLFVASPYLMVCTGHLYGQIARG